MIYYRKDVFAKCGVTFPKPLAGMPEAAKAIKACDGNITPFASPTASSPGSSVRPR